ncbi:toxin secretion/phage lysis holin [Gracilibacillus orientalis]|uniref:Toxin secretion/phage lysis holin n=1 Tax=Gracilibacillus orientalis TaxID=334253 RepID=A0A1I4PNZ0_9BACI|nr:phage holin family protein [Gracilibacillus orientalis]SFM29326.1 toxin secretion/phage lysis holin [Gracilibacillus orientalis]
MFDGNKISLMLKGIGTGIGAVWSFIVGTIGWAFPTLIILMVADFITGSWAGGKEDGLNSNVGRKGFIKKLYILILIGIVYLVEKTIFDTKHLGDGVTIAYVIIEFISLVENGGRLGVPLGPVEKFMAVLKEKGNGK